jgi:hypothetical protein
MNEFMWGVVTGATCAPFAWVALKWGYAKLVDKLD